MAETLDLSTFVERTPAGDSHITLAVDGVGCAACIRKIESGLAKLPGVIDARLNFTQKRLTVDWRADEIDPAQIVKAVEDLGYGAHPFAPARLEAAEDDRAKRLLRCLAVAGFAAMNVMLLSISVWSGNGTDMTQETRDLFHWLSALIALPAAAYAGQPFFHSAWLALRSRQLNMDVPITIGVSLALALSVYETASHAAHAYFDSAIMLLFFLLCGRYLDQMVRRRTKIFAGNLASLKAEFAHRLNAGGELVRVPADALRPGDRVLVRPGERVPADGTVVAGSSAIDESLVTGETTPRGVGAGATVYAGSINFSGALTMRVDAAGSGTLVDEVERLLDKATQAKSQTVRLADRAGRLYAPLVHATAALTALGWLVAGASLHDAIVTAIAVLIITCPCALALAIPAVQVVATGQLFRSGVILNAGDAIERIAAADTVVFDKTGTLTLPEPRADAAGIDPGLLERAARLALSSRHPLAVALARQARQRIPYPGAVEAPGAGVRALIDGTEARLGSAQFCGLAAAEPPAAKADSDASYIVFCHAGRTAQIPIRQVLRPDAVAVTQALTARGLDLIVLSGDRPAAVRPVARQLNTEKWFAGLTPAQKIAVIGLLKGEGRRLLMVGDGLNDAPALAAADVSISPITAAHLTQAHADALFLGERLAPVLRAVAVARQARRLMKQNLALAVIYNALAVPIAILGLVTPLIAALAMSASSILVTLNALRARLAVPDDVDAGAVAMQPSAAMDDRLGTPIEPATKRVGTEWVS
ncbi:MAG TPA: heavy metal translocating P-type ATPase [Xanthobacteraceae bacterium]|nr:heavy metal translocating P-type ATPase [Xanthobacteraceae bacterium]